APPQDPATSSPNPVPAVPTPCASRKPAISVIASRLRRRRSGSRRARRVYPFFGRPVVAVSLAIRIRVWTCTGLAIRALGVPVERIPHGSGQVFDVGIPVGVARLIYRLGLIVLTRARPPAELVALVEGPSPAPAGRALDLGCGTGTDTIYLATHG